jgi:tetratricopeptide (TPR) repeat protein
MEAQFQRALALQTAGRLDEAEALYRRIVDFKPQWTLTNLGVILRTTGRLDEAETTLRAALAADPENASARHSLGMTLLQLGRYAEGWALYEARRQLHPAAEPPSLPEWRGESLKGKRILVVGEQGFGDQILLSRFISRLEAEEVAFACGRPLVRLLSPLAAETFNPQTWDGVTADCWTYLASVPRWLELGPDDAPAPYLTTAPRARTAVGLMLEGRPTNANDARRTPPSAVARAIRGLASFHDLNPDASGAHDFADTAEIMAGLQCVVTVDTSVAHLAGALGEPCWVLMPRPAIDWWANWRDDRTPWYPSLRLIRQSHPGDWSGVIARLAQALSEPATIG